MNNYLFVDAVSYLDADLLAEHLERKDKLRNKLKSKRKVNILRWSAVAVCFTLIVMSILLISNFVDGPDVPGITHGPDVGVTIDNNFFDNLKNGDSTSILDYYPYTEYASFVKMEITEIHDGLYAFDDNQTTKFILVEGIVIKDYYNNIAKDTIVTIPVAINYTTTSNSESNVTQYDEKDISDMLTEFNSFYVYLSSGMNVQKNIYSINDGNSQKIDSLSSKCNLSLYSLLPMEEGNVHLNSLDEFLENNMVSYLRHEKIAGFDKTIYEGQTEAELTENISKMYNYYK